VAGSLHMNECTYPDQHERVPTSQQLGRTGDRELSEAVTW
jgi:hypothetical protein